MIHNGGLAVQKRIVTSLFFLVIVVGMGSLVACENSQTSNNDKTLPEEQSNTASEKTEKTTQATDTIDLQKRVPTMERINTLEEIAMTYYFGYGDLEEAETELFPEADIEDKYDVMREAFNRASVIDPYNLDLKFSLASIDILKRDIPNALTIYDEILNFDENYLNAHVMRTIFSKVEGNDEKHEESLVALKDLNQKTAEEFEQKIQFVESMRDLTFEKEVPNDLSEENHAFIILGYALSDEGEMEDTLLERLKVAKVAAEAYPKSKIIVTGGVPKSGVTEADVMYDWLIEQGIDETRIIKENMATDTIENALFSMDIVNRENLGDLTLITSATHMRRSLTLFNEANDMIQNKNVEERDFSHIIYDDYEDDDTTMSEAEELVIYRDLMRTSGIWLFPGLQR